MKLQRWADFFFVGVVVLPGVLLWMEYFDLGVLLLLPMLFVACGFGWLAQEFPDADAGDKANRPRPPDAADDAEARKFRER